MTGEQPHRWARGLRVICNNENGSKQLVKCSKITPTNITSVVSRSYDSSARLENGAKIPKRTKRYTGEDWRRMGESLRESTVLATLSLDYLTEEAVEELFGEGGQWPVLETLGLRRGKFGNAGAAKILAVLSPLPTFRKLDLSWCKLDSSALGLLASGALNETQIQHLDVRGNKINDHGLESILSARGAKDVVKLYLGGCQLSDDGFALLSQFLGRSDIELKRFFMIVKSSNGEEERKRKQLLATAIPKTSKLETIDLGGQDNRWVDEINDRLFDLVCDTSSVEAVCNSNHCLYSLGQRKRERRISFYYEPIPMGQDLSWLFSMNSDATYRGSTAYAIRRKLEHYYFTKPNFDVRYFNEMDVTIMPRVLSIVQTDDSLKDMNVIYRLVRNCHVSEMFSFPGPKSVLTQLWEKDERIKQLEAENNQLKQEIEELRRPGPASASKRAKTSS